MRKSPTISPRPCISCGVSYTPSSTSQKFCPTCMIEQKRVRQRRYEAHKFPNRKPKQKCTEVCCVCGGVFSSHFDGKPYCNKHYQLMYQYGSPEHRKRAIKNSYDIQGDQTIVTTSKGQKFIISTSDLELVKQHSWCFRSNGYIVANIHGTVTPIHRFLLNPPERLFVDHINGDPSDNRRCNLRICTPKDNSRNCAPTYSSKTGVVGVKIVKSGKYVAQIMVDRKMIILGTFDTLSEAAAVRADAEQRYFGEFAPSTSRIETTVLGVDV